MQKSTTIPQSCSGPTLCHSCTGYWARGLHSPLHHQDSLLINNPCSPVSHTQSQHRKGLQTCNANSQTFPPQIDNLEWDCQYAQHLNDESPSCAFELQVGSCWPNFQSWSRLFKALPCLYCHHSNGPLCNLIGYLTSTAFSSDMMRYLN